MRYANEEIIGERADQRRENSIRVTGANGSADHDDKHVNADDGFCRGAGFAKQLSDQNACRTDSQSDQNLKKALNGRAAGLFIATPPFFLPVFIRSLHSI